MVERVSFGGGGEVGNGICTTCGKRIIEGDPDFGGIQLFRVGADATERRLVAEFCSLECELKQRGVSIFAGEIDALLKSRLKKNGSANNNR
jgi:hypothetical protein